MAFVAERVGKSVEKSSVNRVSCVDVLNARIRRWCERCQLGLYRFVQLDIGEYRHRVP